MITVRIHGGLGNQLFAYSFGYRLSRFRGNEELILDLSWFFNKGPRPYVLDLLNIAEHRKLTYHYKDKRSESMPDELYNEYDFIENQLDEIQS